MLIWGLIPGITWALESSGSCSNRLTTFLLPLVTHHNRCKKLPAKVLPAAQHPNQLRNMFQKSVFFSRKLFVRKSEEVSRKDTMCPVLNSDLKFVAIK